MKTLLRYLPAILLTAFALLTLFLSSSVIFDLFGIREKEGNYVLFIVWANFISSILYLFAAYGFLKSKLWTTWLLAVVTVILFVVFIALMIYINAGGIHESKTIGAMGFRIFVTLVFTVVAYLGITRKYASKFKITS